MDLERAVGELQASLERELAAGMLTVARMVADEAATRHPYTNRTGTLQRRTVAGRVRGSLRVGHWTAEVLGDTPYGGFVEFGTSRNRPYPYLVPAWGRRADDAAATIGRSLEDAARRAGWQT